MTNPANIPPAGPYLHLLERVDLTDGDWPGRGASVTLTPICKGVDRPQGTGIAFQAAERDLAERLKALILAGHAYAGAEIRRDINGNTYVSAEHRFSVTEIHRDLPTLERLAAAG